MTWNSLWQEDNVGGLFVAAGLAFAVAAWLLKKPTGGSPGKSRSDKKLPKSANEKKLVEHTTEFVKPEIITTCGGKVRGPFRNDVTGQGVGTGQWRCQE